MTNEQIDKAAEEFARVLNQDEIDSLLGFEEREESPAERHRWRSETQKDTHFRVTIRPLDWSCQLIKHRGTYGVKLGPVSLSVYWPWHDPTY